MPTPIIKLVECTVTGEILDCQVAVVSPIMFQRMVGGRYPAGLKFQTINRPVERECISAINMLYPWFQAFATDIFRLDASKPLLT
jgi:hypothetical protein